MNANLDPLFEAYGEMDFAEAKPVSQTPVLAKLQAAHGAKSRITIRIDNEVLAIFKARAEMTGENYQTLINEALTQFVQGKTLVEVIREAIRQELHHAV